MPDSSQASPTTPTAPRPRDRAEAAGYPPDSGPEQDVTIVRHAMMRSAPMRFFGLWLLLLGGLVGTVAAFVTAMVPLGVLLVVVAVAAGAWLVWWKVLCMTERLKITNKRSTVIKGLFSRASSEVLHDHVRNVKISQNFWERVWNVGRISISSSADDDDEVEMSGVPRPHEVARIIDLYRPLG